MGGIALALPWLERLEGRAQAQAAARPRRVIVMTYSMGIPTGEWLPSATGATFTLPFATAPLERLKSRCLFVSGLDNAVLNEGGSEFQFGHPAKQEAALTGTLTTGAFPTTNTNQLTDLLPARTTKGGANGPSVEQIIGTSLRAGHPRPSIDLGIDGDKKLGKVASTFFFESRGAAVSLECDPGAAFTQLFASVPGEAPVAGAMAQLQARRKSVLDAVRDSFGELAVGLGHDDRRRLEEHAARIRRIELEMPVARVCSAPTGISAAPNQHMGQISPLQVRILAQAMGCSLAPVGRIEYAHQQSPRFGIPEVDGTLEAIKGTTDWHGMVHGDPLPGTQAFLRPGRNPSVTSYDRRLLLGYRFFVQQFADLLQALDELPEGPGTTVLDNSLCILATDFGDGLGHYHGKMGYILAGHLGRGRRGFHHASANHADGIYGRSRHNVNQLLNSIADMAGVTDASGAPIAEVGLQGFLKKINAPRRIDELFAT